jgi:hypothetical protein
MKEVRKDEFFKELKNANDKLMDPMPRRNSNLWICQKTNKIFGKLIHHPSPIRKSQYFLSE